MATTTNGIYYPNDYDSVADIPVDMKKMAESIDKKITENKTKIEEIKKEQETQNTNISNLQKDNTTNKQDIANIKAKDTDQDKYIAELEAENTRLREDLNGLPTRPASGESIDLNDSAEMRFKSFEVRGNSKQETRSGKNLLQLGVRRISNGITTTLKEDGAFLSTGTITDTWADMNDFVTQELLSGTYTISKTTKEYAISLYLIFEDNTQKNINISKTSLSTTFSISQKAKQYRFWIWDIVKGTTLNVTNYMQLELGSTATSFEPYGAMPSPDYPSEVESCGDNGSINEVICNKNLASLSDYEIGGFNMTTGQPLNGITNQVRTKLYHKVKPNTQYSISSKNVDKIVYLEYDKNKNYIGFTGWIDGNSTTFITGETTYFIKELIRNSNTPIDDINKLTEIQVEQGTATPYEEHKSQTYTIPVQQPFRAIGDIRDTFVKVNGKWYERHYINRIVFDNNTTFMPGNPIYRYFYETNLNNLLNVSPICSHFKGITDLNENNIVVLQNNRVNFYSDKFANITNFNSFIQQQYDAGTPVYLDYVLAEPLDIECTEEQNKILDQIENEAKTYKNITHIYSTDKISPNVSATYSKDIETMINNIAGSGV